MTHGAELEVRGDHAELADLASARDTLERSRDLPQVKGIHDIAVAAMRYAQAKKLGADAVKYAAEIVVLAECKYGELLTGTPKESGGDRRSDTFKSADPEPLKSPRQEAGKKLSARSQKLARVAPAIRDKYLKKAKTPTPTGLLRAAREAEAEEIREQGVEPVSVVADIRIEHTAIDRLDVTPDSVDLVFTDPPYPAEFIPCWSDLGAFAAKALKPGGLLVAYSGQMFLPEAMRRLAEHLDYWWCYAVVHDGAFFQLRVRRTQVGWKPLLVYRKPGGDELPPWVKDIAADGSREKSGHEWQQAESEAAYWIETLTGPGDHVADPFLGSGTTAAVCKRLGRSFTGCDVDAAAVARSRERVA